MSILFKNVFYEAIKLLILLNNLRVYFLNILSDIMESMHKALYALGLKLSTDEWIKKVWCIYIYIYIRMYICGIYIYIHIHTMEYCSAIKNETLPFTVI